MFHRRSQGSPRSRPGLPPHALAAGGGGGAGQESRVQGKHGKTGA